MRTADGLRARLGKAEVPDLALPNQLLHRARHVFNRDVRVDAVLIEEINDIDLEAVKRAFGDFPDVLRATVQFTPPRLAAGSRPEPEFGGDRHLTLERRQCLAHKLFICERAVHLGRIEKRNTAFHGCANE